MRSLLLILTAAAFLVGATRVAKHTSRKCDRPHECIQCFTECPPERTCKNRKYQYRCTYEKRCKLECRCDEGYFRDYLGNCVTEEVCEKCPGDHEFFDCGPECDNECATIHTQNRTNCPYVNVQCNKKCYCEDGYARDDYGNCIPVNECKHVCKRPNEEYAKCKRSCPPDECISLVAFFKCDADEPCHPRCVCKPGFLRKRAGSECMPSEQCTQQANNPDFE